MIRDFGGRLTRAVIGFLACVGLLFLVVTFSPFVSWYAEKLAQPWSEPRGEVLIVLSGPAPNEGTGNPAMNAAMMDPGTYWRCFMAVLYYRERQYTKIVVSGKGAAAGMRDFLVFNGVPETRIIVEDQATNTHENAVFTSRLLSGFRGGIVLLTSDSHMFRARRCFAREGLAVVASSVPDVIKRAGQYSSRSLLFFGEARETAGIFYYWYRGWI
jgi:uncharacterized SAM-binding protein YcdF (DUF218 family)